VFWGEQLWSQVAVARPRKAKAVNVYDYMVEQARRPSEKLAALADRLGSSGRPTSETWKHAVGRDQPLPAPDRRHRPALRRRTGPSIPVPFTSAQWGSLASFGAKRKPGTKKYYGTSLATASWPSSSSATRSAPARCRPAARAAIRPRKHFNDQAMRYSQGNLRDVYFYPEDLKGHIARTYRPGQ
jgi:acyl-homoserine-lactone acylase